MSSIQSRVGAISASGQAGNRIPAGANGCGTSGSADQRGTSRLAGPACDIGAYEEQWQATTLVQSGALVSDWSYALPASLEGIYQIDLRGVDVLGNLNDRRATWNAWHGEIDVLAPRVAITATFLGADTLIEDWAEDFNLSDVDFQFPCAVQAADRQAYDSEW